MQASVQGQVQVQFQFQMEVIMFSSSFLRGVVLGVFAQNLVQVQISSRPKPRSRSKHKFGGTRSNQSWYILWSKRESKFQVQVKIIQFHSSRCECPIPGPGAELVHRPYKRGAISSRGQTQVRFQVSFLFFLRFRTFVLFNLEPTFSFLAFLTACQFNLCFKTACGLFIFGLELTCLCQTY